MYWYERRCGRDGGEGVCVLFLRVSVFVGTAKGCRKVEKELKETREENGRLRSVLEQERSERVRVAQKEVKENMPKCEREAATGDRLAEAMAAGEQQIDNQWRQTSGVEQSKGRRADIHTNQ